MSVPLIRIRAQVVLECTNALDTGHQDGDADQQDPDDHEDEPDATGLTDTDDAPQGVGQETVVAQQRVEHVVGQETGEGVCRDVAELGARILISREATYGSVKLRAVVVRKNGDKDLQKCQ